MYLRRLPRLNFFSSLFPSKFIVIIERIYFGNWVVDLGSGAMCYEATTRRSHFGSGVKSFCTSEGFRDGFEFGGSHSPLRAYGYICKYKKVLHPSSRNMGPQGWKRSQKEGLFGFTWEKMHPGCCLHDSIGSQPVSHLMIKSGISFISPLSLHSPCIYVRSEKKNFFDRCIGAKWSRS